jgi:hypothetical protein
MMAFFKLKQDEKIMALLTSTVKLSSNVEWFGRIINEVTLREPTAAEFIDFGQTHLWGRSPDGTEFTTEKDATIKAYLDKCLQVENGSAILHILGTADGQKIKAALLAFFIQTAAPEISKNDSVNSPST